MSGITVRTPLQELTSRLNLLLDDAWMHSALPAAWEDATLAVDVSEDEAGLVIQASLPGFAASEIAVHVDTGVLSIQAHHEQSEATRTARYHRRERRSGTVSRRIALPGVHGGADVHAELDKGVLTVRINHDGGTTDAKQIAVTVPHL
jgi:HSP20 family molecular chaperone IbpA